MEDKKEYCDNLLNKYQGLKQKTEIKLFNVGRDGKLPEPQSIPFEYFKEFDKARKEIKECFNCFSEEVLMELYDDFRVEIYKILNGRIRN